MGSETMHIREWTILLRTRPMGFPLFREINIFVTVENFLKFHLEFKSNLSPIERHSTQLFLQTHPIYITIAIVSSSTQVQRNFKWN